jgi:hypothetical protein
LALGKDTTLGDSFRKYWTIIVGVLFVFVGLFFALHFHVETLGPKLLIGFVTEIGFALLIAWGVAHVIERGARKEYDNYTKEKAQIISQNVFGYLYSVKLPRSAFDVMEEHIFKAPIIKTEQKLEYELLDPEDDSGWIKMRCEFDYTLKNISDSVVKHPVRFHASRVSVIGAPDIPGLGLQSLFIGPEEIPADKFPEIDLAAADDVGIQKYQVDREIQPNAELRVRVRFVQLKRVDDNDLYQTNTVTESFELKLRYNADMFDVFIEAVHPSSKFDGDIIQNGGRRCRTVSIDQALLPKNGVFMWWNKK